MASWASSVSYVSCVKTLLVQFDTLYFPQLDGRPAGVVQGHIRQLWQRNTYNILLCTYKRPQFREKCSKKYFSKCTTFSKHIFCVTVKTEKFVYIFVDFFFFVVSVLNFCVKLRKLLHFQCLLRRWSVSVLDIWSKLEE